MSYNQNQGEAASYYASASQGQQQSYNQNQQSSYGNQQQQQQDGPTGERGVLGAIGGAVAGGVGGNKIGGKVTGHSKTSTIIGAIAGAVAGHKIQDGVEDWKDKRDDEKEEKKKAEEEAKRREEDEKRKKEEEKRRKEEDEKRKKEEQNRPKPPPQQQQQQHHQTQHQQPQHQQSRDAGVRYAGGFSGSAKDISLDQAGGEYILRASCRGKDGNYRSSSIALNGILSNDRGSFRWSSGGGNNNCGSKPAQYTVVAGDTLRQIGGRFGVSWEELARHNCIQNPDLIFPGQVLNIPGVSAGNNGGGSGGGNFGASARNVRLEDGGKKLVAELKKDGQWVGASIVLDEKIGNDNGSLVYKN